MIKQDPARRESLTHIPEMAAERLHAVEFAHLPRRHAHPRLAEAFDIRVSETVHDLHHGLQVVLAVAFLWIFTETVSLPAHGGEGSLSRKRTKARRMNLARTRTRSSNEAVSRICTHAYQLWTSGKACRRERTSDVTQLAVRLNRAITS